MWWCVCGRDGDSQTFNIRSEADDFELLAETLVLVGDCLFVDVDN